MNLAERLGVVVDDALRAELHERLAESAALTPEHLTMLGIPTIEDPRLGDVALPASLEEVLLVCVADARANGAAPHADALLLWYCDALPRERASQLWDARNAWLFHTPVPWDALPRFRAGVEKLFVLLGGAGAAVMGARDADAWLRARATIADFYLATHYGRLQPMFGANAHELARLAREVEGLDERARWSTIDRRLAQAMLHELLHFGAARRTLYPLHLDEAIAGYLGILIDERVAYPAPGEDNALIGCPWYAQMGAALARVSSDQALLLAQAGQIAWESIFPGELIRALELQGFAAYRAAPAIHTLPDPTRPQPWVDLIYAHALPLPDPARDRALLGHALRALCLHATQVDGAWQVTARAPDGPVTVDFRNGLVRAPARTSGWEPAPLAHALPPSLRCDRPSIEVMLDPDPVAIDTVVRRLS